MPCAHRSMLREEVAPEGVVAGHRWGMRHLRAGGSGFNGIVVG